MVPNPSLLVRPHSGFVPFSSGGTPVGDLDEAVAPSANAVLPVEPPPGIGFAPAAWEPATSKAARRVEAAVLAAICGYFTFGLGRLLLGSF